jgi:acyl carrier protein
MEVLEEWDSLAHMRIILAIEAQLGREIAPEVLFEISSLKDIADIIGDE